MSLEIVVSLEPPPDPCIEQRRQLMDDLRRKFEKRRQHQRFRHLTFTFDEMVELFENPFFSWRQIAQKFGTTIGHVSKLYRSFGEPLVNLPGYQRFRRRVDLRHEYLKEQCREMPNAQDDAVLSTVARAAERRGLTVHRVPAVGHPGEFRKQALRIDGNLCMVHHPDHPHMINKRDPRRYYRVQLSRANVSEYGAHLFCLGENILVVPTYFLVKLSPRHPRKIMSWIPADGFGKWRKYLGAWPLLEGED